MAAAELRVWRDGAVTGAGHDIRCGRNGRNDWCFDDARRIGEIRQGAALTGLLFLLSAGTSYLSIRYGNRTGLGQTCEQIADLLFVVGLIGISTISIFFAYEVI